MKYLLEIENYKDTVVKQIDMTVPEKEREERICREKIGHFKR